MYLNLDFRPHGFSSIYCTKLMWKVVFTQEKLSMLQSNWTQPPRDVNELQVKEAVNKFQMKECVIME